MNIKGGTLGGLLRRVEVVGACTTYIKTSFLCPKPWHDYLARHSLGSQQSRARKGDISCKAIDGQEKVIGYHSSQICRAEHKSTTSQALCDSLYRLERTPGTAFGRLR